MPCQPGLLAAASEQDDPPPGPEQGSTQGGSQQRSTTSALPKEPCQRGLVQLGNKVPPGPVVADKEDAVVPRHLLPPGLVAPDREDTPAAALHAAKGSSGPPSKR